MIVIDIKSDMPTVEEAINRLKDAIGYYKGKVKVIKVLHGYGSTGVGGKIKHATHQELSRRLYSRQIKAFIPGESFTNQSGFVDIIQIYKDLIKGDSDYGKSNDGITYVIF